MTDLIIIGGGPAGAQAAIYTSRANVKTTIITKKQTSWQNANIQNYYGCSSVMGEKLFNRGLRQAKSFGAQVIYDEVVHIEYLGDGFNVKTVNGEYKSKALIVAVGASRQKPQIKGVVEFEGNGVSYCAVCDGFFYKNKTVAVIGDGEYALSEAQILTRTCKSVTLFTNGTNLTTNKFTVISDKIISIDGNQKVSSITTEKGVYYIDGVFVAQGVMGAAAISATVGVIQQNGFIVVDKDMQTNVKGLFSAGDCVAGEKQIAKAVYDGLKAGNAVIRYLKKGNASV